MNNILEFDADIYLESSWGSRPLGKARNIMTFTENTGYKNYMPTLDGVDRQHAHIEWEVNLDSGDEDFESIGIYTETVDGKRTLYDYDGTASLPIQAVTLLKQVGITVPDEFDDSIEEKDSE